MEVRVAQEISMEIQVTPEMMVSLRKELGESLAEFGLRLRRALDPRAETGYTRQYISRLEHGKDAVTPEIASAFYAIAARLDGVPAGVGGALWVQVMALPGQVQEGSYVKPSLRSKLCEYPLCRVVFIGPGKYHSAECAKEMRKLRRANDKAKLRAERHS